MAKQFEVRAPVLEPAKAAEKIAEIVDARKDDWKEALLATITTQSFSAWRSLAISGYKATPAPDAWKDMHEIGLIIVTYDAFSAGVAVGEDIWALKLKAEHVLNKFKVQYGGNKYILEEARKIMKDKVDPVLEKYTGRAKFQAVSMEYGRKYLEAKLQELVLGVAPDYTAIDNAFSAALVNKVKVDPANVSEIITRIKTAAFSGAQYIYSQATGQP